MRISIVILILISLRCYSQDNYTERLSVILEEIKGLDIYDNGIVILHDTEDQWWGFPQWKASDGYFEGDFVKFKQCMYCALKNTKGKSPENSPNEWRLYKGRPPYLFLRDTAKLEDLERLLSSNHPYIRTYAFGALSYRKYDGLFSVLVDNLGDKTKIEEISGDVVSEAYPAQLMIQYQIYKLRRRKKSILRKLIRTKYHHLNSSLELLGGK
jgi:hypothetical protein